MFKSIQIDNSDFNFAKSIACNVKNEITRKKSYYFIAILHALEKYFSSIKVDFNISSSLFYIDKFIDEFEFADAYLNGLYIQVAFVFQEENAVPIPKSQFIASLEPSIYIVVRLDDTLSEFNIIGSINTNFLNKISEDDKYYYIDANSLNSPDNIFNDVNKALQNFNKINNCSFASAIETHFLEFLDTNLDNTQVVELIKHLIQCDDCRSSLISYYKFEKILMDNCNDISIEKETINYEKIDDLPLENENTDINIENNNTDLSNEILMEDELFEENIEEPNNININSLNETFFENNDNQTIQSEIIENNIEEIDNDQSIIFEKDDFELELNNLEEINIENMNFEEEEEEIQNGTLSNNLYNNKINEEDTQIDDFNEEPPTSNNFLNFHSENVNDDDNIVEENNIVCEEMADKYNNNMPEDKDFNYDSIKFENMLETTNEQFTNYDYYDKKEENKEVNTLYSENESINDNTKKIKDKIKNTKSNEAISLGKIILFILFMCVLCGSVFVAFKYKDKIITLMPFMKSEKNEVIDLPNEPSTQLPLNNNTEMPDKNNKKEVVKNNENNIINTDIKPRPFKITQIAWETDEKLMQNAVFNKYLVDAGKNIQLNLKTESNSSEKTVYNSGMKIEIVIDKNSKVQFIDVLKTSGSKEVDELVLKYIKNTINYIKPPILDIYSNSNQIILEINF